MGYLLLFEKVEKKIQKIHVVKLTVSINGKKKVNKVDCVDNLLFKKPAQKLVNHLISGESLILTLTDHKVKTTKRKARFLTLVLNLVK